MQMPTAFPDYRLDDPKRQAEWRVYQEIAGSETPGLALYEVRASLHSPEVDFLVWVEGVACFAIEVKGGQHFVEDGLLFRKSPEGPQRVDNPLPKAMDAAFSVRDAISEKLRYKSFVISALLFPDMEEDPKINIWAAASLTYVMFGLDNLVQRLTELDDVTSVRRPPTAQRIQQEAAVFLTGTQSEAETARPRRWRSPQHCAPRKRQRRCMLSRSLFINWWSTFAADRASPTSSGRPHPVTATT